MESTGVYWKPVFNLLEADHRIILVNAQHLQTVPGRKTDLKACSVAGRVAAPDVPWPAQGQLHPAPSARSPSGSGVS